MRNAAVLDPVESFVELLVRRMRDALGAEPLPRRFLSKEALAEHYGVSERTVKTWRSKGLPACDARQRLLDLYAQGRISADELPPGVFGLV